MRFSTPFPSLGKGFLDLASVLLGMSQVFLPVITIPLRQFRSMQD
jgi:hypothetical protein